MASIYLKTTTKNDLISQLKHLELSYSKYNNINSMTKTLTNQRKMVYRLENLNTLTLYRFFLYLIYYILLPILLIVFLKGKGFLLNKLYKNYKVIIPLIILIVFYIIVALPSKFDIFIIYIHKWGIFIANTIKYFIL